VLPGSGRVDVSRPASGGSTPVYRLRRGGTTRYLRLAETAGADLAPEARVHDRLRALGVSVPEVVDYDSCDARLGRSVMVTTEIAGEPIGRRYAGVDAGAVLTAAGRDLAIIATIPVEGFGWVRRDRPVEAGIAAESPSLRAFAPGGVDDHLAALGPVLGAAGCRAVREALDRHSTFFDGGQAVLAHGDLDTTHIYHRGGYYAGIIDFGEIRGADRWYDLGHFALHDGEHLPSPATHHLLAGYHQVHCPAPDDGERMRLWSILIGLRTLARIESRPHGRYHAFLTGAVRRAIDTLPA